MFTGLFVVVLGIGFIAAGLRYVSLARRMRTFRSTPGKIIARTVAVLPGGDTRAGAFGEGGGYMPSVRYRYVVAGAELEGDKISLAYAGKKRAIAERNLAAIPDDVVVWFNPQKPSEAYLKKHTATIGVLVLILGALFEIGGALKVIVSIG